VRCRPHHAAAVGISCAAIEQSGYFIAHTHPLVPYGPLVSLSRIVSGRISRSAGPALRLRTGLAKAPSPSRVCVASESPHQGRVACLMTSTAVRAAPGGARPAALAPCSSPFLERSGSHLWRWEVTPRVAPIVLAGLAIES
jgi:hypothetical protein